MNTIAALYKEHAVEIDKQLNGELRLRRIVVGKIPAIILNIGSVKYKSNIPSGYFMVVDTPGQVPYRPGGTSPRENYSIWGGDNQGGKNE